MKNMKVSAKLLLSFILVVILTGIVGVVGIFGMQQISAGSTEMYYEQVQPIVSMAYAAEYFQRIRVQMRNVALNAGDTAAISTFVNELEDRRTQFAYYFEDFRTYIRTDEGIRTANAIDDAYYNRFSPGIDELITAAREDADTATLMSILDRTAEAGDIVANNISEIMAIRVSQAYELESANENLSNMMLVVIIAVLVLAVAIALFLAFYISGLISKPLVTLSAFFNKAGSTGNIELTEDDKRMISKYGENKDEIGQTIKGSTTFIGLVTTIATELETVANGDLTSTLTPVSNKDVMGNALVKMLANLNNMFAEINNASGQVSSGSKQISDGAQSLAQGSTEQAASVQQLSSSISEIAQKTKENAEMAGRAASLASNIKTSAEKGSGQMDEMMTAVKDINESSQNISKVIKSIDDIAFQTNILALNAAVEAARAGQNGKGFAVVAEEVRNLAAKSAEAAKDTESLIADSITKAELGSRIADDTSASLKEIVSGIDESTRLVGDIARSSDEQSAGIDQINKGVDQVAQVVQQNSATAEESAAASEEMSGQSIMLEELISRFKLRDSGSGYQSLPAAAAPIPEAAPQANLPPAADMSSDLGDFGKY